MEIETWIYTRLLKAIPSPLEGEGSLPLTLTLSQRERGFYGTAVT